MTAPSDFFVARARGEGASREPEPALAKAGVGLVRERFFTPRLRVKSYEELNAWLLDKCVAYAKGHKHPELPDKTIWQAFEEERPKLVPVAGRFDACRAAIKVRTRIASFDGVPEANLIASPGMFPSDSVRRDRGPGIGAAVSWFGRQVFLRPSLRMVQAARAAAVKAGADALPEGLGLEGREHAPTLIGAGTLSAAVTARLSAASAFARLRLC